MLKINPSVMQKRTWFILIWKEEIFENKKNFFEQLRRVPGVVQASGINQSLIREDGGSSTYGVEWPGKIENRNIDFMIRQWMNNLLAHWVCK
jgi:hypothetical protein